jgi:hypothetical protein
MKRLPLPCPVLLALPALLALLVSTGARAEWLTLTGSPGDATSSYVQVDPTTVQVDGSHRLMNLRLSVAQERTTKDGLRFRSFRARVNVDCEARNARYVSATYFGHPDFVGEPIAVRVFEADDVRPMALAGAPRDLAGRTINAACSVSGKEQREPRSRRCRRCLRCLRRLKGQPACAPSPPPCRSETAGTRWGRSTSARGATPSGASAWAASGRA